MTLSDFISAARARGDRLKISNIGYYAYLEMGESLPRIPLPDGLSSTAEISEDIIYWYCELRGHDPRDFGLDPVDDP